jgi:putative protease
MPQETPLPEEGKLIGEVTHYYGKIGVGIIKLTGALNVNDRIRIAGGDVDFTQEVGSMEIDHKKVEAAKSGDVIGLRVDQKVREGYKVYKL